MTIHYYKQMQVQGDCQVTIKR